MQRPVKSLGLPEEARSASNAFGISCNDTLMGTSVFLLTATLKACSGHFTLYLLCLIADGFRLEWVFFSILFVFYFDRQRGIDTWIQDAVEQTTAQAL